jgi:hypothetical protein
MLETASTIKIRFLEPGVRRKDHEALRPGRAS